MARNFNGGTDVANLSLGAGGSLNGAATLAGIVKFASDGAIHYVLSIGSVTASLRSLRVTGANKIAFRTGNNSGPVSTTSVLAADGWLLIAVTKAAGAAVTPRFHIYKYSTATWTHEAGSTTAADSTPTTASAIGRDVGAGGSSMQGDIAVCGAWTTAMTDAQVETLASDFAKWFSYSPNGLWVLDQSATALKVWDYTGGGANESGLSGTTVSTTAVPVWNRGAPPLNVDAFSTGTPASLALAPATITVTGIAQGITPGSVSPALSPATITTTPLAQGVTPGAATRALSPASINVTPVVQGVSAGAVTVALSPATVSLAAQVLGLTSGLVSLSLTPASITVAAQTFGITVVVVLPDPNPITATVRDRGHTATVEDEGHSVTARTR